MPETKVQQIAQLNNAIAVLEAQRETLGDSLVDTALAPLRARLAELSGELPEQQRKLVTLLFMDVVESTPLVRQLDPEEALQMMDTALKRLAAPVEARRGRVTRFMGDGFKAVFGLPLAREDDPEQAVLAGLEIQQVAKEIGEELLARRGVPGFQVRVGINSGRVASGGLTELEDTVMGSPVNLAARLQSAAPPGGVLISHDTYRHVRGLFDVTPQEPILPKGFEQPVRVYLVERRKPRAFRLQALEVEGVETRMVGREMELKRLQEALTTAMEDGEGQLVTVIGEAGVGKSRLLYEFTKWIELLPQGVRFFQGRCRPEAQGQPYALWREVFAYRFRVQEGDAPAEVRRKLERGFGEIFGTKPQGEEQTHLLAQLLGYDFSGSPHLKGVLADPQQLRHRGLNYLDEFFRLQCQAAPTVVFLEDIHWADDSSLDAIGHLGRTTPQQPLLIVCLARHALLERRPYWGEGLAYHSCLELRPLNRRESRQLVDDILQKVEQAPPELKNLIVGGAEGNPFYIEELVKMLVEQGVIRTGEERWLVEMERLEQASLPSTLSGVLQARLDWLPAEERQVLQQASVVGRIFWDQAVAHIQAASHDWQSPEALEARPAAGVSSALANLRGRELVYRREESAIAGAGEYLFKHEVLRDVTYESVLLRLRRVYHGLVAEWLIERSAGREGETSGLIAAHLEQSGQPERAIPYLLRAGDHARAAYANQEAERFYRHGLELNPPPAERVELLSGLGEVMYGSGHYQEAIEVWLEGVEFYRGLGNLDGLARLYARAARAAWYQEGPVRGLQLCEQGLEEIRGAPESVELALLYHEAGRAYYFLGNTDRALTYCRQALDLAERFGAVEVQADTLATLGILAGLPLEQRRETLEKAVELCERHGLWRIALRALNNLCAGYWEVTGDVIAEYQIYQRQTEIARRLGARADELWSRINIIGIALYFHELTGLAGEIEELERFSCEMEVSDTHRYSLFGVKTNWLLHMGSWDQGIESLRQILPEIFRRRDVQYIRGGVIMLTRCSLEKDSFEALGDWAEVETALAEMVPYEYDKVEDNSFLSSVQARQGRLVEARQSLKTGREAAGSPPVFWEEIWLLVAEYELALAEQHWDDALAISARLIEMFSGKGIHWHRARALLWQAEVYTRRGAPGDAEKARDYYRQSQEAFQALGAEGYVKAIQKRLNV